MESSPPNGHSARKLAFLCLTALGVVYGDIGTSPLYSMRECFFGPHAVPANRENILGVLSLLFWSLVLIVSVKYLSYVLKADNRGEGGILSLMALAIRHRPGPKASFVILSLGIFGAALLYGDGIITPAITVLSAIEGLEVATPLFQPYVVPLTLLILLGLFLFQRKGTAGVGMIFGPVMVIWFLVIGLLGALSMLRDLSVLQALNPLFAARFFLENGAKGYLVLGAVLLVLTGAEALYADLGHFGVRPVRLNWFSLVLPTLLLNYFGQGALLLRDTAAAKNPFYLLAPDWARIPLVVLAAAASVIASQAVISGVFSLTRQAVQLGYAPRVSILHTSSEEIGQIYIPAANWGLMALCMALVLGFRTSSNLAAAYGIAVITTMLITTLLAFVVARRLWGWPLWAAASLTLLFTVIDLAFFGANIIKVAQGGWFPLAIGLLIFTLMATWKRGRQILSDRLREESLPVDLFLADVASRNPLRVPGTAVFMTGNPTGVPPALLHNLKHNQVLHQRIVFLTVLTEEEPHVPESRRFVLEELGNGFFRLLVRYGFMQTPNLLDTLRRAEREDLSFNLMKTTFFLGRENLIASKRPGMALWREKLFIFLSRNSQGATGYFGIPPNRVVELGAQIEI